MRPAQTARRFGLPVSAALAAALLLACAAPPVGRLDYVAPILPEVGSGYQGKPGWATKRFAVAAANPLATDAGYQVLKAGGSAIDAAIAVQMVLGLVEPQSSGIAGGAFMLHHDGRTVQAYDGRETAPAAADERLFLDAAGKPIGFADAIVGGRAVGTPGVLRMLEVAHRKHGKLPWARLFVPAIRLADDGFTVSHRLATQIAGDAHLRKDPAAAAYFYPGGQPLAAGTRLQNPAYAEVLRRVARDGAKALHEGPVAAAIVAKVNGHPTNPGRLSLADLAGYAPKQREPFCTEYTARPAAAAPKAYVVCGMPPPSSGAIAVAQILGLLGHTPAHTRPLVAGADAASGMTPDADFLHLYTEASRLAYADRAQYVADPDFVSPPGGSWASLIAPRYLAERSKLIGTAPDSPSMKTATPGDPGRSPTAHAPMTQQTEGGTSHISIVDAAGNTLAMTTTIEAVFGARQLTDGGTGQAGGFVLNNQLSDFSFAPADAQGLPIANRVQPGKRPRSSMAPTLVFERKPDGSRGELVASLGSPGGAVIIHFTTKTLYGLLNWGLDAQRAIDLPNFGSLNGPSLLERGRFAAATVQALRARGAPVNEVEITSGLQAIARTPGGWFGGADPRREGVVRGD